MTIPDNYFPEKPDFTNNPVKVFEYYFNRYYKALYSLSYKFVKDEWIATEIVMETFLKLWNQLEKFETDQHVKAFLYITMRNKSWNYVRDKRRLDNRKKDYYDKQNEKLVFDIESEIDTRLMLKEIIKAIRNDLPPKMKQVITLLFFDGLTVKEISRILGLSHSTIRGHKAEAILRLRQILINKGIIGFRG